jgi:hypothetical protein
VASEQHRPLFSFEAILSPRFCHAHPFFLVLEIRAKTITGERVTVGSPARRPGFSFSLSTLRKPAQQKSRVRLDIEPELQVEVMEDAQGLDFTLPGTNYRITFRKLADIPGISGAHDIRQDDPEASLSRSEFLSRAWTIAKRTARELGWIG